MYHLASLLFSLSAISATTFIPSIDYHKMAKKTIEEEKKGSAPIYAIPHKVKIVPKWIQKSSKYIWKHEVSSPGAVSLNFGFTKFHLPKSAKLNIYSKDHSQFIRTFTNQDNSESNELWTPVILTDFAIIEVEVNENDLSKIQIELGQIGQGFRTFSQTVSKSGYCNVDVACSDSTGWENEVNAVGVISTGGSTFCTGFMINNTSNDKTPYFVTAEHCGVNSKNAASLVVYWNYQTSKCGGERDGKLTDFQTGAVHLKSNYSSDFTLLKLNQSPLPSWNVAYAGWNAQDMTSVQSVGIHHPGTDEKAISFDHDSSEISSYSGNTTPGDSTHIRVLDWDLGTTEPGSSGSPLFDENHRVIGQLHGGGAACDNDESDYYGRFYISWKSGIKKFLDKDNTGKLTTDTIL